MKKCFEQYNYFKYLENKMSETEQQSFEEHLKLCPHCQIMINQLQLIDNWKEQKQNVMLSAYFYDNLLHKLKHENEIEHRYKKWQPVLIVTLCTIAVFLGILLGNYYSNRILNNNTAGYLQVNEINQETIELSLLQ